MFFMHKQGENHFDTKKLRSSVAVQRFLISKMKSAAYSGVGSPNLNEFRSEFVTGLMTPAIPNDSVSIGSLEKNIIDPLGFSRKHT
jgi:hypothetical protein